MGQSVGFASLSLCAALIIIPIALLSPQLIPSEDSLTLEKQRKKATVRLSATHHSPEAVR